MPTKDKKQKVNKDFGPSTGVVRWKKPEGRQIPIDLSKIRILKTITVPLWKWADNEEKVFRIEEPIRIGKAMKATADKDGKPGKEMEPAHVVRVTRLDVGMECEIIVGAVLMGNLEENYPNQSYVGKCFISQQTKAEGKRYRNYSLAEVDIAGAGK